jgi:hypothetical protein
MPDEKMTLIERFRNPTWVHGFAGSAVLDTEATVNDLQSAAECIEFLESTETNKILKLTMALREAERFMAYFSGETDGYFVGDGMPRKCLDEIRTALQHVSTPHV